MKIYNQTNVHLITALMGDCKDPLRALPQGEGDEDILTGTAFVDDQRKDLKVPGWNVRTVPWGGHPANVVRRVKLDPFNCMEGIYDGDVVIWADASFEISSIKSFMHWIQDCDLVVLEHPFHKDLVQEAVALYRANDPQALHWNMALRSAVKEHYRAGLPDDIPHTIGGLYAARVNAYTRYFFQQWQGWYRRYEDDCQRDQIHMGRALFESCNSVRIEYIPCDYSKDTKFGFRFHKA
jgi:hypothetical protein